MAVDTHRFYNNPLVGGCSPNRLYMANKMKIFRPLKSNQVNQWFGENHVPFYKEAGMKGHNGIDFGCWSGEPIYHSADWRGIVNTEVDREGGYGVEIVSESQIDGTNWKIKYWHLKDFNVHDGQKVNPGDLLGHGDNTGLSTGDHLHFGLKKCYTNGKPKYRWNGYYGGIDPKPYLENEFILKYLNLKQQVSLYKKVVGLMKKLLQKL